MTTLKAPFPYFGGKRAIADVVWSAFGDVPNYVEPFAGSAAILLNRPAPFSGAETLNDYSCSLVNAWRAIAQRPNELTELLVGPVCEVNTEAQHWALIKREQSLRNELGDPDYCDVKFAAFWIRGANEWIGSGWCNADGPWSWTRDSGWLNASQLPHLGDAGTGINRQLPHLGDAGTGINRKLPHLGDAGTGINRQLPHLGNAGTGINRQLPHLGNAGKGEYDLRCKFVSAWLDALRDRLVGVRIACGSWERVLTPSVCQKHGLTAVFLDPPYDATEYVYGDATENISSQVREWCVTNGATGDFRIVLAGRGTEHDPLIAHGWRSQAWTANRGYSLDSNTGRSEEMLWISPTCVEFKGQSSFQF